MKRLLLIAGIAGMILTGCTKYRAEVRSDTSWSGAFGNTTIDGSGNQDIELSKEEKCAVVQKRTTYGSLSVQIVAHGSIFSSGSGEKATTTAEYGVVSSCGD